MALDQPTLAEIQTNIENDLAARFGSPIPLLSKAVWRVLAAVLSGCWYILYTYATDAFKQRFIQTANIDYLKLLGSIVGIFQIPATTYQADITVVSTGYTGTLTSSTQFLRADTGVVYQVETNTDIVVGDNTVPILALESGAIANLNIGQTLDFVAPLAGINSEVTIEAVTQFGDDAEATETYRQRVLLRYRLTPQGGASVDYVLWASESPNYLNSYPYATIGAPGQVDLHLEVDNQTDGIPTTGQLTAVYDGYINIDPDTGLQSRRPVTAEVNMLPITRRAEDIVVVALSPDTSEIRAAISAQLTTVLLTYEPYIEGVTLTRNDFIKKSKLSGAVESVTDAFGATFDDIVVSYLGIPYSSAVLAKGQKTKLGTLGYTS